MKQQLQNPNGSRKRSKHFIAACSSGKHSVYLIILLLILFVLASKQSNAQGVWQPVASQAPHLNDGVMLLLSDGTVIAVGVGTIFDIGGNNWDRLTPDSLGSYINGTWTSIAPMNDTRLYFSSQMLMDGRLYVAGGEYGTGGNYAETYDPLTDTWTMAQPTGYHFSDANSEILPDGRVLEAIVGFGDSHGTIIYNPAANNWNFSPPTHGVHNESTWVKLRDSSILMVDMPTTSSERYIPSLNKWVVDDTVPVSLYDPYGWETGPGFLLPDGRAFMIGSPGNTAYYAPSGDTSDGDWEAGPTIPDGQGAPDAAGAMMVNGKILCALSPVPSLFGGTFQNPTSYYEFDYLTNSFTRILAPTGDSTVDEPCYYTGMLDLPDGSVLYSDQYSSQYYVYTPHGSSLAAGKPTISNIVQDECGSFTITGTQFNGISEGASFGDDWQMNTNYPIIRLTSGAHVYYARTFNWNSTGVQRGSLPDTTQFTLPSGLPPGVYWLVVTANGISSDSIKFIPFPILSSTLTPPPICSNTVFSYLPTSYDSTATFTWTRAAVAGISNVEIAVPQVTNPNEILINTTSSAVSVIYAYAITANGCTDTQEVTVLVYPLPSQTIGGPSAVCQGDSITLTATGGTSYLWSNNDTVASITISPTSATTYSVIVTNSYACTATDSQLVTVNLLPVVAFIGLPDTVCSYIDNVTLTGDPAGGAFDGAGITGNVFNPSSVVSGNYTITYFYTDSMGCENSANQIVSVSLCTGISELGYLGYDDMLAYPNPADQMIRVAFRLKDGGSYSIRLLDMLGTTMRDETDIAGGGVSSHLINLDGISDGVYMIILQKGDDVYKTKIMVH